jgi:predicted metal-dependent enzyme (double-stranded beta helix superfamily)
VLNPKMYGVDELVGDLQRLAAEIADERVLMARLRPLAQRAALSPGWVRPQYYECDTVQGFGVHLLHEEAGHELAVFALAWLPGRGAPPHNHGTWAVVAGVDGVETNCYWRRTDDGSQPGHASLRCTTTRKIKPGEVCVLSRAAIHSVSNDTRRVTLSLHIYGKHLNYTGRSQFDPRAQRELPFLISVN